MAAPHHPIAEQLAWLAAQPIEELTREACQANLVELGRVTRFVQSLHARIAARLDEVSPTPEADHTAGTRGSAAGSGKATRRGRGRNNSGEAGKGLGDAMDQGEVSGEHLDVFLAIQATLPPVVRQQFCADDERIVAWATHYDVDAFRRLLRGFADELRRQYGIDLLEQQQRDTMLRTWIDERGMLRITAAFDPLNGLSLRAALDAELEALHREPTPPNAPHDPVARQNFLRAHALMRLLQRGPTRSPGHRAELVIVADTTTLNQHGEPSIDWGLPIELPLDALARFYADVERTTIVDVTRAGTIRDLGAQLNLGRSTRLANRAQRRLLRVLHPTCIIPGCTSPFQYCHIHHITWWRHGGATDLDNLAPLCNTHHSQVHQNRWRLSLDIRRNVTVTLTNGDTITNTHAPPWFDPPVSGVSSLSP
jgi:hypothetical protein